MAFVLAFDGGELTGIKPLGFVVAPAQDVILFTGCGKSGFLWCALLRTCFHAEYRSRPGRINMHEKSKTGISHTCFENKKKKEMVKNYQAIGAKIKIFNS